MAKNPRTMTTGIAVDKADLAAFQRAYAAHSRDVERETQRAADRHAQGLIPIIRAAAAARGRQAALAAQSVRYVDSDPPTIRAGGSVTVSPSRPGPRPRGGDIFFGSEFGSSTGQFPPRSPSGWWYLRTVTGSMGRLRRDYVDALQKAARRWGSGG